MMGRSRLFWTVAMLAAVAAVCMPASAEDVEWTNYPGVLMSASWFTPSNWTSDPLLPADGQSVGFLSNNGNQEMEIDVDNAGLGVNLPGSAMRIEAKVDFVDGSGTDDAMVFDEIAFNGSGGRGIEVYVPLTAPLVTSNRHGAKFFAPATIDTLRALGQHQNHFAFEVSPTGPLTLIELAATDTGHNDDFSVNADVTTATFTQTRGDLYVGSGATFTITGAWNYVDGHIVNNGAISGPAPAAMAVGSEWRAGADGALPATPITIPGGSGMFLNAAQSPANWTSANKVTIESGGLLAGDMTSANFDPLDANQNASVAPGAIYAPTVEPVPLTRTDVGGTVFLGVTDMNYQNGLESYTTGDDGSTTLYRGFAIGGFTATYNNGRVGGVFNQLAGTGNMQISNAINRTWVRQFTMVGDGSSTTADIYCTAGPTWQNANKDAIDAGTPGIIDTFNFYGDAGDENRQILNIDRNTNDTSVDVSQTINIQNGSLRIDVNNGLNANMAGTIQIGDGGGLQIDGTSTNKFNNATAKFEFQSGSALRVETEDIEIFEDLTPAQFVVESGPAKAPILSYRQEEIVIDAAAANFQRLQHASDVVIATYRTVAFSGTEGLQIGDGRFVMNDNRTEAANIGTNRYGVDTTYFGIAPGATMMGLAPMSNSVNIGMHTEAGGATLQIGNDVEMTNLNNNGSLQRHSQVPTGTVSLNGTVNADNVIVKSGVDPVHLTLTDTVTAPNGLVMDSVGNLQINGDTIDDAGLNVMVNKGTMRFGGVAENTTRDFSGGSITIGPNAYMNADLGGGGASRELAIGNLTVNSPYVGGSSGVRIDDGTFISVAGTLAGTGSFGYRNYALVESTGTLAPGNSVGELNKGGVRIHLADGASYDWEIADPEGDPGTGWDLVWGSRIVFDVDDDDIGALTFNIIDAGIPVPVEAAHEFVVAASPGGIDVPATWNLTFNAPVGWDVSTAELLTDSRDIDGDASPENVLYLTGVAAPLGLSWDGGGLDGKWETAANWNPNQKPTATDLCTIGTDVDNYAVLLDQVDEEALGVQLANATLDIADTGTLAVGQDVTVADVSTLNVNGTLSAAEVICEGTLSGDGRIEADFIEIVGVVSPGSSVGMLTVDGELELIEGKYLCEIDGTGADRLHNANEDEAIILSYEGGGGTLELLVLKTLGVPGCYTDTILSTSGAGEIDGDFPDGQKPAEGDYLDYGVFLDGYETVNTGAGVNYNLNLFQAGQGDTDGDGDVDLDDLSVLDDGWDPTAEDKIWTDGDVDGDGDVDLDDLSLLDDNWAPAGYPVVNCPFGGGGLGATAVPEPGTLVLLAMSLVGLAVLAVRRRRRVV